MGVEISLTTHQAVILSRAILPGSAEYSVPMAQYLVDLTLADVDEERMNLLAAKARDGDLSDTEEAEIADYRELGHVLETIKSRARQTLKRAGDATK
jgi:hypothetical protein